MQAGSGSGTMEATAMAPVLAKGSEMEKAVKVVVATGTVRWQGPVRVSAVGTATLQSSRHHGACAAGRSNMCKAANMHA